ncbi:hypothetical protein BDV29DRAFT_157917 [Aspergillus leporis]|jgi:hypothetical protein|uniref:Uncharacterized protein n=1 Tax=Aspergillus leporis TaxID=41062 RepID=A0A5N5WZH6_9EURO|nr:hypothetical protein BDV29DRAFT_157917 [Aspergillus leporis]
MYIYRGLFNFPANPDNYYTAENEQFTVVFPTSLKMHEPAIVIWKWTTTTSDGGVDGSHVVGKAIGRINGLSYTKKEGLTLCFCYDDGDGEDGYYFQAKFGPEANSVETMAVTMFDDHEDVKSDFNLNLFAYHAAITSPLSAVSDGQLTGDSACYLYFGCDRSNVLELVAFHTTAIVKGQDVYFMTEGLKDEKLTLESADTTQHGVRAFQFSRTFGGVRQTYNGEFDKAGKTLEMKLTIGGTAPIQYPMTYVYPQRRKKRRVILASNSEVFNDTQDEVVWCELHRDQDSAALEGKIVGSLGIALGFGGLLLGAPQLQVAAEMQLAYGIVSLAFSALTFVSSLLDNEDPKGLLFPGDNMKRTDSDHPINNNAATFLKTSVINNVLLLKRGITGALGEDRRNLTELETLGSTSWTEILEMHLPNPEHRWYMETCSAIRINGFRFGKVGDGDPIDDDISDLAKASAGTMWTTSNDYRNPRKHATPWHDDSTLNPDSTKAFWLLDTVMKGKKGDFVCHLPDSERVLLQLKGGKCKVKIPSDGRSVGTGVNTPDEARRKIAANDREGQYDVYIFEEDRTAPTVFGHKKDNVEFISGSNDEKCYVWLSVRETTYFQRLRYLESD